MLRTVEEQLEELIQNIGKEHSVLRYVYNKKDNFIAGVTPVYYSGPYFLDNEEIIQGIKTLLTGTWIASGEEVRKFENEFSKKINQKHCLMVNSGSSANLVMIAAVKKVLKWNDNDEIITSVVGFPTTIAPICQNNLVPSFVDIEMDSLNFDIDLIEEKINDRTRAILLSPVLGNPPDMDRIISICNKHNLILLLDNCDSLGSKWDGKFLNEYCYASSNSFFVSHHLTTFEGGAIVSNDKELIRLARSYAWWGRSCFCVGSANLLPNGVCGNRFDNHLENHDGIIDHKYVFETMGYNLKPLDFQGSIGLVQLKKFDEIHNKRIYNKERIAKCLLKFLDINDSKKHDKAETSWFGVPIICKNKEQKELLVSYFENKKIQTRHYFAGNILLHNGYKHLGDYSEYPNANKVLSHVFFIGCTPQYTEEVLCYIEKVISEYEK